MRGVYEKPEGSGIWWIHYYAAGKRHREKVGRKSDAMKLYQSRKADATAGRKLPELRDSKVMRFSELIDDALEFVADHKDRRSYISKARLSAKRLARALQQRSLHRNLIAGSGLTARHLPPQTAIRPSFRFATVRAFTTTRPPSIPQDRFATVARESVVCAS